MITVLYKKKHIYVNLALGIIWLANGIFQTFFNEKFYWFNLLWFVLALCYFYLFYNQKVKQYLTLGNGVIKQNWPYGKKMFLNDIVEIRHFAGDFILKSKDAKLSINGQVIEEYSRTELINALKKLDVKWT